MSTTSFLTAIVQCLALGILVAVGAIGSIYLPTRTTAFIQGQMRLFFRSLITILLVAVEASLGASIVGYCILWKLGSHSSIPENYQTALCVAEYLSFAPVLAIFFLFPLSVFITAMFWNRERKRENSTKTK